MSENNSIAAQFVADRVKSKGATDERRQLMALSWTVPNLINLGRGDPDLETPPHIIEAAKKGLDNGQTHYTPWAGTMELRRAIAEKFKKDNGFEVDPATEVLVTVGAQEAIFLTMMAVLNPGDEVIVPVPRYTPYDTCIDVAGGVLVPVETTMENDFEVQAEDIEKKITSKTKAILIINPNNPTGALVSRKTLEGIAAMAEKHNLLVISDELYEKLVFDDQEHVSFASLPGMKERTITVNGISKTYSMTGWRIGYLAAPKEIINPMTNLKYAVTICATAVAQCAALEALTGPQQCLDEIVDTYNKRRLLTMSRLDKMGIPYCRPKGTFYLFMDIRKLGVKAYDFAETLLKETGVFLFPSSVFGENVEGFIRLSLLMPEDKINEAFDRMEDFMKRYQK